MCTSGSCVRAKVLLSNTGQSSAAILRHSTHLEVSLPAVALIPQGQEGGGKGRHVNDA